jgi:drug/metabolite transporter (DMT)-like permease
MKTWHYAFMVFLGGCCFGILSTFVKIAYSAGFTMPAVTGSQFVFGTCMIWLVTIFTKKKKISLIQTGKIILAGIPTGLTGILYYQSLQTLPASLAIIFLFQFIWMGTLLEWFVYKRRPSSGKLLSIGILLTGSILGAGVLEDSVGPINWEGAAFGLLAAFTFSLFILLTSMIGNNVPSVQKSALLSTGGMIITVLLFPPVFLNDLPTLLDITPYGLVLGIFGVVLPPLFFSIGMPHVGPGLGTILTASELPVAVVLSAFVLTEVISPLQWLGVCLILAGIIFGNKNGIIEKESAAS